MKLDKTRYPGINYSEILNADHIGKNVVLAIAVCTLDLHENTACCRQ